MNVSFDARTVGEILAELTKLDKRYKVQGTADPRVVNLLLQNLATDTHQLLAVKVHRFDMEVEEWPQNWFLNLQQFAPEVRSYLKQYLAAADKVGSFQGSPGANMTGNVRPPHVSMHMSNVSVLDILNALASKSIEMLSDKAAQTAGVTLYPQGWVCSLPPVGTEAGLLPSFCEAFP